jgi:hypothetical protein
MTSDGLLSTRNGLLVSRYLSKVSRYLLIVSRYLSKVSRYLLIVSHYLLIVSRYLLKNSLYFSVENIAMEKTTRCFNRNFVMEGHSYNGRPIKSARDDNSSHHPCRHTINK